MSHIFQYIIIFNAGLYLTFAADARAYTCIYKATIQYELIGCIDFEQNGQSVMLTGMMNNLTEGLHGFHVHEYGNMSNACLAAGGHYNPFNNSHGAPTDTNRHVGDLGNINAAADGTANININDTIISLTGTYSIIGRAVVVHEKPDDLGINKTDPGSQTTGNAGARIGCGIIVMTTDCTLQSGPAVKYIYMDPTSQQYAYAGVRLNPGYFCVTIDPNNPTLLAIRYKMLLSPNKTDELQQNSNGCQFHAGQCTDPALRQQIIDSNFCNFNAQPQQIVDRLLLTLNRPNWLYIYIDVVGSWDIPRNDNFCQINLIRDRDVGIFAIAIDMG